MRAARLVCKLWVEEGGVVYWKDLQLWNVNDWEDFKLLGVLKRYHIRSFVLAGLGSDELRKDILSSFDGLEELELHSGKWDASVFTLPNLKTLKSLALFDVNVESDDVLVPTFGIGFELEKLRTWQYDSSSPTPLFIFFNPFFNHLEFYGDVHDPESFGRDFPPTFCTSTQNSHSSPVGYRGRQ